MAEEILPTGAFSTSLAKLRTKRGNWHFDAGLADELKQFARERTVFDFGAGIGRYCEVLRCRGVDGIPGVAELSSGLVIEGDLTDPGLMLPDCDVALCLEVAEHIPREHEATFLKHLLRSCRWLVISWAVPGQAGTGHVNCRSEAEVVERLRVRGFSVDQAMTRQLRESAVIPWLRNHVLLLERTKEVP